MNDYCNILLCANGDVSIVGNSDNYHIDYKELQSSISCDCFDIVRCRLDKHLLLVVDDNGLLEDLPVNVLGSLLYGDVLVGDVLVCTDICPDSSEEPDAFKMPLSMACKYFDFFKSNSERQNPVLGMLKKAGCKIHWDSATFYNFPE